MCTATFYAAPHRHKPVTSWVNAAVRIGARSWTRTA